MPDEAKRVSSTFINERDFEEMYLNYFPRLLRFAFEYVEIKEDAENIVQDVFLSIWEHRKSINIHTNPANYLLTLTKNRCVDYFRHKAITAKGEKKLQENFEIELQMKLYSLEALETVFETTNDIERMVARAIDGLPEKCRNIFIRNKIDGKRYKEIAEEMNLSINTVESQMSIALRKLREYLKVKS